MEFVKVAEAADVPAGSMKAVDVKGVEVLIVNVGGRHYAMGNKCTHAGGRLSEGKLDGNIVTCPKHGSKFDITTGRSVQGPKIAFLKLKAKDDSSYEVKVEGGAITVGIP